MRPRIQVRHQVITDSTAAILVADNTRRKPRIPAEVLSTMRNSANHPAFIPECNDLFHTSKVRMMIIKALFKGKTFSYRNSNLDQEQHLNTTPVGKTANLTREFIKRQFASQRIMRKAQDSSQALSLVA